MEELWFDVMLFIGVLETNAKQIAYKKTHM